MVRGGGPPCRLGLARQQYTTQIEHYDNVGALCHTMSRSVNRHPAWVE